jgi:hypothetical protein
MPDNTKNLTAEPQQGLLVYMRPNFDTTDVVGEFSLRTGSNGKQIVVARRRYGRNKWNLCPLDYVVEFKKGEGYL